MIRQALHIYIWQLSAILHLTCSPLKLWQLGWGLTDIFRFLQKCLIGSKPKLLLGHSRTFTELFISHSCCVLWVIVLLEGEPSAQSEVLNALDWVFIKAISIFCCVELSFYSVPAAEKQPHSMRLLPAHFTFGMVLCRWWAWWACFPPNMMLGFEVHQTWESCFSQSESSLGALLQIPNVFSCVFTSHTPP